MIWLLGRFSAKPRDSFAKSRPGFSISSFFALLSEHSLFPCVFHPKHVLVMAPLRLWDKMLAVQPRGSRVLALYASCCDICIFPWTMPARHLR